MEVIVCSGCEGGAALAQAARAACPGVALRRVPCLSVCTDPATLAIGAPGGATYVFSGLTAADADDVAVLVAAYGAAPLGWIEDARPLGTLRFKLVARVPAILL